MDIKEPQIVEPFINGPQIQEPQIQEPIILDPPIVLPPPISEGAPFVVDPFVAANVTSPADVVFLIGVMSLKD